MYAALVLLAITLIVNVIGTLDPGLDLTKDGESMMAKATQMREPTRAPPASAGKPSLRRNPFEPRR